MGSSATRDRVMSERYAGYSSELKPGPDSINGNPIYYGNEWIYSGTRPPTVAQYRGAVLAAAARADAHGWTALSFVSHREHTRRKNDPYGVLMYRFRSDVLKVLRAGPNATKTYVATGVLTTTTTDAGGNDMANWTEAQLRAMMQAEEEEYAIRFWIDPTGTGTGLRNMVLASKLQLDRIESALAQHSSNTLQPLALDADGMSAQTRELATALENSVAGLDARPAQAELAQFLNADGTMDPA
jgi:hypothetical protein